MEHLLHKLCIIREEKAREVVENLLPNSKLTDCRYRSLMLL
jgi:hypothetical protein